MACSATQYAAGSAYWVVYGGGLARVNVFAGSALVSLRCRALARRLF